MELILVKLGVRWFWLLWIWIMLLHELWAVHVGIIAIYQTWRNHKMIIVIRFEVLCLGKPPTAGGETRQMLSRRRSLVRWRASSFGAGELRIAGSRHLSFMLSMLRFYVCLSPHCMFVHVAQDNSYLRDLFNLAQNMFVVRWIIWFSMFHVR